MRSPHLFLFASCISATICLLPAAAEPQANTMAIPGKILGTGTDVYASTLSPNALSLAKQLKLMPLFYRLQELRARLRAGSGETTLENLAARQELTEARQEILEVIEKAQMDVDFVLAELHDERNIYSELMTAYTATRDKTVALTNAFSFTTNGALWAVAEALDIPTWSRPKYSISSGTFGILAGLVPTAASLMTLKEVGGFRHSSPAAPNMLSKIFDRPTNPEIEYPTTVWQFLNTAPAGEADGKTRRNQLIGKWIADKNIPSFTDRASTRQVDLVTASTPQKRAVTISVLFLRMTMLQSLEDEIFKMNRLLLELMMVLRDEKHV